MFLRKSFIPQAQIREIEQLGYRNITNIPTGGLTYIHIILSEGKIEKYIIDDPEGQIRLYMLPENSHWGAVIQKKEQYAEIKVLPEEENSVTLLILIPKNYTFTLQSEVKNNQKGLP